MSRLLEMQRRRDAIQRYVISVEPFLKELSNLESMMPVTYQVDSNGVWTKLERHNWPQWAKDKAQALQMMIDAIGDGVFRECQTTMEDGTMSRYNRHNPDEPINHDWFAPGIRTKERTMIEEDIYKHKCPNCGEEFTPTWRSEKYCDDCECKRYDYFEQKGKDKARGEE